MPNYDYFCTQCGHKEEILQKMTDTPLKECPLCKKNTFKRKFGRGIGLQFQGSGFYSTDYGNQSSNQSNPSEKDKTTPPSSGSGCGCGKSSCGS